MTFSQHGTALIRSILLTASLAVILLASACSSSSPTQSNQFAFVTPKTGPVIDQGQTVAVTVNQSANWTLTAPFGTPPGTNIGSLAATAGSTSATYMACAPTNTVTCLANQQVVITATSTADATQTAALVVSIPPPPTITTASPISVPCSSIPPGTVVLPNAVGQLPYLFVWTTGVSAFRDLAASGGVAPYTWSVSSGTLPTGMSLSQDFNTNQMSINGAPTSSTCADFTLQITDAAGVSVTLPYTILVLPPALSVQLPPVSTAYGGVPYPPTALKASGGLPPYFWIPDPNSNAIFPPGLALSVPGSNPNIAVITGTPDPANVGNAYTPAVFVHDSQLPYPGSAHLFISLGPNGGTLNTANGACSEASGATASLAPSAPYAFLLRGFDAHGPVVISGNFTTDGAGNISSGTEDINRSTGVQGNLTINAGSSYTMGGDNRGCLTLANSAGTTLTFQTAWGTCSTSASQFPQAGCQNNGYFKHGRILVEDTATGIRATGIVRLQDPTAFTNTALSGLYAFGFSGWDAAGGRYAIAGSASASSGAFSSVTADINDAGTLGSDLTGGSGTYNFASSGRGTGTISAGSANLGFVVYPVSASEAIFATSDALDATHPMLSGEALAATAGIKAQNLANSYILRTSGIASSAPDVTLGVLALDGATGVAGTVYENAAGTLSTTTVGETFAVDATTGRLLFTVGQNQNAPPHPLVGYMAAPASGIAAFVVSTDASAQFGVMEFQAPNPPLTTFSNSSLIGPRFLATDELMDVHTEDSAGTFYASGNGGFAGSTGLNQDVGFVGGPMPGPIGLQPNLAFSAGYSVGKTGTGTLSGQFVSVTNGSSVYYLDESPLNFHPAVTVVEQ